MSKVCALVCAALLAALFPPFPDAKAAPPPFYVSLHYEVAGAAERCWDEAEFRRNVARAVGYEPFRADATVAVRVQVGGSASLVDGGVEWRNEKGAGMGERRFRAKDGNCAKLLTEMSFAVGLQIELLRPKPVTSTTASSAGNGTEAAPSGSATGANTPALAPTTSPSGAAPPATPPSASSAARPSETPPVAEQHAAAADHAEPEPGTAANATPLRLSGGVGPSLTWGLSPSMTAEGRFFFGARRSDLSLELALEGTLPVTERATDGSGFRQNLLGVGSALCAHRRALVGCVLGRASELRVSGRGVDQPRAASALVVQAGLRLAATWEMSGVWFASPHTDLLALITPRSVALNQLDVWEMPLLSVVAGIDVAARFR